MDVICLLQMKTADTAYMAQVWPGSFPNFLGGSWDEATVRRLDFGGPWWLTC